VSRKKEICFPNIVPVTHGSADSPVVAGALWSRSCQSPSKNIHIGSLAGTLLGIWGHVWGKNCFCCRQSIFQCSSCPLGQGLVGGCGLGQDFAQCPRFLHQKQNLDSWVLWVGSLGR
jgi:hypothetical protein